MELRVAETKGTAGRKLKRRLLLGLPLGLFVGVPAARIMYLKIQDNLLDPVADPEIVFADGWVLDASDRIHADGL